MPPRHLRIASLLFFASGATGLIYQVVWSRVLNEVFGISAYAVTAVLATYLGGLALGAWLLGRWADRARAPLRLYGVLELGIALAASTGTYAAGWLDGLHLRAASLLSPSSPALLAIRALLAAVVVLPATVLMGATLPVMTKVFVARIGRLGRGLGGLYAINTAGAVLGSLLAGFVLIRAAGIHGTLWLSVAVNVFIGAAALLLARRAPPPVPEEAGERPESGDRSDPEPGTRWGLLVAVGLSGFASLSLEVVWTRMLLLVLGTSTYSFVTMLATFLSGIALGSFAARARIDRLRRPRLAFGLLQAAVAAATLATIPLVRTVLLHGSTWFEVEANWFGLASVRFGTAFLVMIVPTCLIGASFPLATRIWATRVGSLGGRVGEVYAANTAGNILGALVGGFVLLPTIGMQRGVVAVAVVYLGAAAWGFLPARRSGAGGALRTAGALAAVAAGALLLVAWHPTPLPSTGGAPVDSVLYYEEGLVSTVKVFQKASDGSQRVMAVDGITIGQSSAGVDKKQQVLAHLPFLLAPEGSVRDVLSIGLGTGILVAEAAKHRDVRRVEVVEISPSVIEGSRFFGQYNGGVPDHPGIRVIPDDGVLYLRRSGGRYDAIVADGKSRSGHAGNAVFYSEDFYRAAIDHMAPEGTFVQWIPLDVAPEELRIIVRTFARSFPHLYVWLGQESCFLVGRTVPLRLDVGRVRQALRQSEAADLARYGWSQAEEAAALLIGDRSSVASWIAGEDEVNSLERPFLEFFSLLGSADGERSRVAANLKALAGVRARGLSDVEIAGAREEDLERARSSVAALLAGLVALKVDAPQAGFELRRAAEGAPPGGIVRHVVAEAFGEVGRALDLSGRPDDALAWYREALWAWPGFVEAHVNSARIAAARGRLDEARGHLESALASNPLSGSAHRLLGQILSASGDVSGAVPHLRRASRLAPADAEAHGDLGVALVGTGAGRDALAEFQAALLIRPDWAAAMGRVALLLAATPDAGLRRPPEAIRMARRATEQDPSDPSLLEILAASYAAAGRFDEATDAERRALRLALVAGDRARVGEAQTLVERYRRRLPPEPLPASAPQ